VALQAEWSSKEQVKQEQIWPGSEWCDYQAGSIQIFQKLECSRGAGSFSEAGEFLHPRHEQHPCPKTGWPILGHFWAKQQLQAASSASTSKPILAFAVISFVIYLPRASNTYIVSTIPRVSSSKHILFK
jgi:hypothetical protein